MISWYARLEYEENLTEEIYQKEFNENALDKTCIFKTQIKCPELRLWLVETAKEGKYITDEDVLTLYDEACSYVKNRKDNLQQWNNAWKKYIIKLFQVIKAETY